MGAAVEAIRIAPPVRFGLYIPSNHRRGPDRKGQIKLNHRLAEGIYL